MPSPTRRVLSRSESPTRKADIIDLSKKFGELESMWKDTLERSSTPRRKASRSSSARHLSRSTTPRVLSQNISRNNSLRKTTPTPLSSKTEDGRTAAEIAEAQFLERSQQQGKPPKPEAVTASAPPAACWKCGLDLTTAKVPPKFCRECGSRLVP